MNTLVTAVTTKVDQCPFHGKLAVPLQVHIYIDNICLTNHLYDVLPRMISVYGCLLLFVIDLWIKIAFFDCPLADAEDGRFFMQPWTLATLAGGGLLRFLKIHF